MSAFEWPYECDECGVGFMDEKALNGHQSAHVPDAPAEVLRADE